MTTCGERFLPDAPKAPEDPEGPCILDAGHDGPHQEEAGSMWWDGAT